MGWSLYSLLGIAHGDRAASWVAAGRNFEFFGAPVGLIFTLDRYLGMGSWLDLGIFMQSIMLAARGEGLDTCCQAAWRHYHDVIRDVAPISDQEIVVCGMSLGHADPAAIANRLRSEREPVEGFARFVTAAPSAKHHTSCAEQCDATPDFLDKSAGATPTAPAIWYEGRTYDYDWLRLTKLALRPGALRRRVLGRRLHRELAAEPPHGLRGSVRCASAAATGAAAQPRATAGECIDVMSMFAPEWLFIHVSFADALEDIRAAVPSLRGVVVVDGTGRPIRAWMPSWQPRATCPSIPISVARTW